MSFEDINKKAELTYEPNSFGGAKEDAQYLEPSYPIEGDAARYDRSLNNDHFYQARDLFNLMNDKQKNLLFTNLAAGMQGVPSEIIDRQIALFEQVSPDYANGVKKAL